MKFAIAAAAALAAAGPSCAQDVTFTPLAEARIRGETVEQDGLADEAEALTMRVRAGLSASGRGWSALAEAQGNLALIDRYYDGLHGAATRPLVADPESIGLYRAQIQYRAPGLTLTAGRQRIGLDDERFVGAAPFRQNGQTFDAVRAEITPVRGITGNLVYSWSVRTIWGIDGTGARQRAVSGDNFLATLAAATPAGTVTGFAYVIDQDEAAVQGFRLSSTSFGVRLAGAQPVAPGVRIAYQASYARQRDQGRNPNDYAASYYLADAWLEVAGFRFGGGYEVLGADDGAALTSFQTPLGTNFKFQGWADRFLTTPPDGVTDLYAGAGWSLPTLGRLRAISVQAVYHRFGSDRMPRPYGDEFNLIASARLGRYTLSARYADYRANGFATDTRRHWLQLDWNF